MKLEPVECSFSNRPQVGYFEATLSPDGWEQTKYTNDSGLHLRPREVEEFSQLVNSFFHECKTQSDLRKYVKKFGIPIDTVTAEIHYELRLLAYKVTVMGYQITIAPHRKENA